MDLFFVQCVVYVRSPLVVLVATKVANITEMGRRFTMQTHSPIRTALSIRHGIIKTQVGFPQKDAWRIQFLKKESLKRFLSRRHKGVVRHYTVCACVCVVQFIKRAEMLTELS